MLIRFGSTWLRPEDVTKCEALNLVTGENPKWSAKVSFRDNTALTCLTCDTEAEAVAAIEDFLRRAGLAEIQPFKGTGKAAYRNDANPARKFLLERYEANFDGEVSKSVIHDEYVKWCHENGHRPLAYNKFRLEVFRAFQNVEEGQRTFEGSQFHIYKGMSPISPETPQSESLQA